ncbi:MAG: peptidoglycan-binding protein [Bifidobacteriaceae bacterium]|jgi:peptidoglycan hydrolase-like protein with peptidoglycan-binding domain|nr:peptidoglycan-binding protein [Bifidobacteriaceae bacterium]
MAGRREGRAARAGSAWRAAALGLAVGLGVGGGAAFYLADPPAPGYVAEEGGIDAVTVTARTFADERKAPARAARAPEWKALAPSAGVVRRADCEAGTAVRSGAAPFVLDDRPVVFLRLSTPPWRDMWPGTRGADVAALQKELRRLGHKDVPKDGYFGTQTAAAVRQLWESAGGNAKQDWVPLDQLVWLPERSVTPVSCPWRIGDKANLGDVLFTVGGGLASLTVSLPPDAVGGARVAALGEAAAPIGEDGSIDDPGFLAEYAKTTEFADFLNDPASALNVAVRLAEPIQVAAVPPSSLYSLADGAGCVMDESGPLRVEVVASQLGETFVAGPVLPSRVVVDPAGTKDSGQRCE